MSFQERMKKIGQETAIESHSPGQLGIVIRYHRHADICYCDRHNGQAILPSARHTADVTISQGLRKKICLDVPILQQRSGFSDLGFQNGDRVWIHFANGDFAYPMILGVYQNHAEEKPFYQKLQFGPPSWTTNRRNN